MNEICLYKLYKKQELEQQKENVVYIRKPELVEDEEEELKK